MLRLICLDNHLTVQSEYKSKQEHIRVEQRDGTRGLVPWTRKRAVKYTQETKAFWRIKYPLTLHWNTRGDHEVSTWRGCWR
eukprot:1340991-Pyramimonas_sp.AAC.1